MWGLRLQDLNGSLGSVGIKSSGDEFLGLHQILLIASEAEWDARRNRIRYPNRSEGLWQASW